MKEIILDTGHVVQVDDNDYPFLITCYDLKIDGNGYVDCKVKKKYKKMGLISNMGLHKLLINPERKGRNSNVDHEDGEKLNNQRFNLRIATHAQNMQNRKPSIGGTSKYKGVRWIKRNQKWQCLIAIKGKAVHLGYFTNEDAAGNCYNYYAKEYYGEFARFNDVPYMLRNEWMEFNPVKNKTSMYRGVSKVDGKWKSQIWDGKKNYNLGSYNTELEAALAYEEQRIKMGRKKNPIFDNLKYEKIFEETL